MIFEELKKLKLEHEQVVFCRDQKTGLKAIIAIHNTRRGPSLGGCRMYPYKTEQEALKDVLNLSEAMSYKSAFADLDLGGGKSVIIGDPEKDKTPELLEAFGTFIDSLSGRYISAKDVGIKDEDLISIQKKTQYVVGVPNGNSSTSPSPATAKGVFYSLKWAVQKKLKKDNLAGLRVVIQGAGAVGQYLMEFLLKEGAQVSIYDIQQETLLELKKQYPSIHILRKEEELFTTDCDVFAPCAMGGVLNRQTINKLKCSIIAGAANNQLENASIAEQLLKKDILHLPDFVINSGGLILVSSLLEPLKSNEWVENQLMKIPESLEGIYEIAMQKNISMDQAAFTFAIDKIEKSDNTVKNFFKNKKDNNIQNNNKIN